MFAVRNRQVNNNLKQAAFKGPFSSEILCSRFFLFWNRAIVKWRTLIGGLLESRRPVFSKQDSSRRARKVRSSFFLVIMETDESNDLQVHVEFNAYGSRIYAGSEEEEEEEEEELRRRRGDCGT